MHEALITLRQRRGFQPRAAPTGSRLARRASDSGAIEERWCGAAERASPRRGAPKRGAGRAPRVAWGGPGRPDPPGGGGRGAGVELAGRARGGDGGRGRGGAGPGAPPDGAVRGGAGRRAPGPSAARGRPPRRSPPGSGAASLPRRGAVRRRMEPRPRDGHSCGRDAASRRRGAEERARSGARRGRQVGRRGAGGGKSSARAERPSAAGCPAPLPPRAALRGGRAAAARCAGLRGSAHLPARLPCFILPFQMRCCSRRAFAASPQADVSAPGGS